MAAPTSLKYIVDATTFSTVNASTNTAITSTLPQGAIDFYYTGMAKHTWYRYYASVSTSVIETGDFLRLVSGGVAGIDNGIMQKLSNLIVGSSYDIILNLNISVTGTPKLLIYSGLQLISTHTLAGSRSQTITFKASSTEDTLVLFTDSGTTLLEVDSISIVTTPRTIQPNPGEVLYPAFISQRGIVNFTDGVNAILPSQQQCEAYGYTYNKVLDTCSAFTFNSNLPEAFNNNSNKLYGSRNSTQSETLNTLIMGENNTVLGSSRNSIITGSNNVISNLINNANVSGTLGEATADNSIVLGGNKGGDSLGERQTITLMYGGQTDDNSVVDSYLNNVTGSYFQIPENTIVLFETQTVAVRIGGSGAGSLGDYKTFTEVGAAINKSGVLSISSSRTILSSVGTTAGWLPSVGVSGTNFLQQVQGKNNRDIMWATTIRFTQIKTGVAL